MDVSYLFFDGYKLFYWFRVAASCTTRNSPYICGKHTAASSKVFWCRDASLGWPCNAPQPAWGNSPQPWSNQQGWQGQRAAPVCPQPTAQLPAVLNLQCWIKHADSRHFLRGFQLRFLGWGRAKLFRSPLDAPIALWCFTAPVTGACACTSALLGGSVHGPAALHSWELTLLPALHLQLPASPAA